MNKVTVIIPVYNAFELSQVCLESVLQSSGADVKVLVIDDCSGAGLFSDFISATIKSDSRLKIIRLPENGGYVRAINHGIELAGRDDVILLNSDTEVSPKWIEKLHAAAYSSEKIGTVTPFTNRGNIASFPRFCRSNELPEGISLEELNKIFEKVSSRAYPELPTSVGHCTYIKRKLIDEIGLFDVHNFGLGYGEENDFSCRAQLKGWVDVLDDATYIYHKENSSFGDLKIKLSETNTKKMHELHPHYFDRVSKFCSRDTLRTVRAPVIDELVDRANTSGLIRVLHVLHNGPHEPKRDPLGGTEFHVKDLIASVKDATHWTLTPLKTCYILTAHLGYTEREFVLPLSDTSLKAIFSRDNFDLVHLHHSRWLDHMELVEALLAHGKYLISFHDYTLVCPRMHLYTPFHKACNRHECVQMCSYKEHYIKEYREATRKLLTGAAARICFSRSTADLVEDALNEKFQWDLIPHGIHASTDQKVASETNANDQANFKIAFLGHVPLHKGSLIIEKLIEHQQLNNGRVIEWHVLGQLFLNTDKVIQHGQYQREEIQSLLNSVKPDLVMILSLCPETFCLTLEEALSASIPVMVSNLGAPAERVLQSGAGWVVDSLDYESVWSQLNRIVADQLEYNKVKQLAFSYPIRTVAEEGRDLSLVYGKLKPKKLAEYAMLRSYLKQFGLLWAPKAPLYIRILGKLATIAIYTLDSMKLRYRVQRLAQRLLPRKFYHVLKSAR